MLTHARIMHDIFCLVELALDTTRRILRYPHEDYQDRVSLQTSLIDSLAMYVFKVTVTNRCVE